MADEVDIKQHLAEAAANIVNGARRGSYGKPENNFGRIALLWSAWFRAKGWIIMDIASAEARSVDLYSDDASACEVEFSAREVSPMMRLMKEARLCETPDHYDSHLDIVGYAMTGAEVNGVKVPLTPEQDAVRQVTAHIEVKYAEEMEQLRNRVAQLADENAMLRNMQSPQAEEEDTNV